MVLGNCATVDWNCYFSSGRVPTKYYRLSTILVVADSHVTPNTDNSRFDVLGRFIVDKKPDTIVQLGDFASMESLSRWDKDKRLTIEGRRVLADLEAASDAWSRVDRALALYQETQRKRKERLYKPNLIWFEGNHEDWIRQYVDRNAELWDLIDFQRQMEIYRDLYSSTTWHTWKETEVVDGILFSHAPIGRTGAISSKYISSRALAEITSISMVFGHTHRLCGDTVSRFLLEGSSTIRAVSAGCFFEETPGYAEGNNNDYWKGVLLLHVGFDGMFDVEEWSLDRLRRTYENY